MSNYPEDTRDDPSMRNRIVYACYGAGRNEAPPIMPTSNPSAQIIRETCGSPRGLELTVSHALPRLTPMTDVHHLGEKRNL